MPERLVIVLLLLLFTTGCAGLRLMWAQDPVGQVEEALAEEDFERAHSIIANLPRRHAQHEAVQAQRPRLEEKASAFEQERIARAEALAGEHRWRDALETLDEALLRWPRGQALQETRAQIQEREYRALLGVRADLALAESRWLMHQHRPRELLSDFATPRAAEQRDRLAERRVTLADEMRHLASELREEDWARVERLLEAARSLSPEKGIDEDLLEEARNRLAREDASRRARVREGLREQIREDLRRYAESGRVEDLLRARSHLPENPDEGLREEYRKIRELVNRRVERDLARGDSLYAQGAYREALESWKVLVPLAPEHEGLRSRLNRLERVLHSLERLEGS